MNAPELILHIGAPKCGSSALQTALSLTPDLSDAKGRPYAYSSVWQNASGHLDVLFGKDARLRALASPYGYSSWPYLSRLEDPKHIFDALTRCRAAARRAGFTPILSNEGWIHYPEAFDAYLKTQGYPPVGVVAFLRPPVDWVNAAFWQWGIWVTPSLDVWLDRSGMGYDFAEKLARWNEIPNVTLHVRRPQPDVVGKFGALFDLDLAQVGVNNAASPAALIGFLVRNRRFRKDGHDAATEFVIQRWCPAIEVRKPWAIAVRHVHRLRETCSKTVETLKAVLPDEALSDLFVDEKWMAEAPYHPAILAGTSPLDDIAETALLFDALVAGVKKASSAAAKPRRPKDLPQKPAPTADIAAWDEALCEVVDRLLEADAAVRSAAQKPYARMMALRKLKFWR